MALLMALGRVSEQGILPIVPHGQCTCPLGRSRHRQSRAASKSTGLNKGTARGAHGGCKVSRSGQGGADGLRVGLVGLGGGGCMAEWFECWNEEIRAAAAALGDVCVFILHTLARTWQRVAWGRMIGSLAVTGMFWPPHTPHRQPTPTSPDVLSQGLERGALRDQP